MLIAFLLTMTLVSALGISLAIPLILRRVKPNGRYGLRTSDTFADEQVWFDANAASGRDLLKLALAQLVGLYLPLLFWPVRLGYYLFGNLALMGLGAIAITTVGVSRAHHMRKDRPLS
jgi:hypothetical protein